MTGWEPVIRISDPAQPAILLHRRMESLIKNRPPERSFWLPKTAELASILSPRKKAFSASVSS
jgi:hypothetical protein